MSGFGRADLHIHTNASDGRPSPGEVVDFVVGHTNLDLIAITDHDTIDGALVAADLGLARGLPVIIGEEVSSREGHILGLFLQRPIKPGLSAQATVDAIHAQGGLAIAAHPFWRTTPNKSGSRPAHGVGWKGAELDLDAIEIENSTPGLGLANLVARRFCAGTSLPPVGGSDAHIASAIGRAATSFPGRTVADLQQAILAGTTGAERHRYDPATLLRYAAWGINLQLSPARYQAAAPELGREGFL
ncbi:MAG TPA: CehA/McbA family metallohydrolase [Candidatus Dormibacteraeota bacterium]|nr:CehA/McbA family metallohydrolase [Candidatus Dormibacteraeota bacterium]